MRDHRPKYSELTKEQRIKSRARAYANVYMRRGILKKSPCMICGEKGFVQKHHHDYSQPLDVIWLCKMHHIESHYPSVELEISR